MVGGLLSDRFGRRKTLGVFLAATALPTLWLAYAMFGAHWIHAIDPRMVNRPVVPANLVQVFWIACLVYNAFGAPWHPCALRGHHAGTATSYGLYGVLNLTSVRRSGGGCGKSRYVYAPWVMVALRLCTCILMKNAQA